MPSLGVTGSRVILDVGQYPILQQTRSKILRNEGYLVLEVGTDMEFSEQLANGDFDLAILCDSLSLSKQRKMALMIVQHRPLTPVLVLAPGLITEYDFGTLTVKNEPQSFLAAVAKLLRLFQPAN
jgi:hypothetical protein